ncbi:MAG: hypothetical protein JWN74_104 [Acidobacteriaceae bacterium]|nr:hypothetical protein [Acidobacteriaceae bacterium]
MSFLCNFMNEAETSKRTASLMDEIRQSLDLLEANLPREIDGFALSQKSKLPWKLLLYREALTWRFAELTRSAFDSLSNDRLVSGIVLTRAAVEPSAALWYLCTKVTAVVDTRMIGDFDEYLTKLTMGTATGNWPEDSSPDDEIRLPRPVRIGTFLQHAEKDIEGYSHQYGILSEYAHPNWAGTVLLYSNTDKLTAVTDFGRNFRKGHNAKGVGNLSVGLEYLPGEVQLHL